MRQLLLATRNQGKLHELQTILAGVPFKVVSLAGMGHVPEIEETGESFLANARQKAIHFSRQSDALTLADDSGLEVRALGGVPGIRSARFGGAGLSDEDRCGLVLQQMAKIPWEERTARFVCALTLAQSGAAVRDFRGVVEGLIAFEPRGKNGFGYDPIFYYPPLARTFGELPRAEKDTVSHRGLALAALKDYLEEI